ncbi:MAG: 50S ribosomal protein L13 [Patescibacteria group bacterium]|nr:50S ribosomal protein L13 [Patescibacteria group bacterium]
MKKLTQQTTPVKLQEVERYWHLIDAKDKILGRLASQITKFLQGKNKPSYVPYLDVGDYVVVINAKKIIITGKKKETKVYTSYSGYPGGLKIRKFRDLIETKPDFVIKKAVSGMLPKNKFRKERLKRLFVYPSEDHPFKDKFLGRDR